MKKHSGKLNVNFSVAATTGKQATVTVMCVYVCVCVQVVSPRCSSSLLCFSSLILCLQRRRKRMIFRAA